MKKKQPKKEPHPEAVGTILQHLPMALSKQAEVMHRMAESIQQYIIRDQSEHKELMIMLKVVLKSIEDLKEGKDGA